MTSLSRARVSGKRAPARTIQPLPTCQMLKPKERALSYQLPLRSMMTRLRTHRRWKRQSAAREEEGPMLLPLSSIVIVSGTP